MYDIILRKSSASTQFGVSGMGGGGGGNPTATLKTATLVFSDLDSISNFEGSNLVSKMGDCSKPVFSFYQVVGTNLDTLISREHKSHNLSD